MTPEQQRIAIAEACGVVRLLSKAELLPAFVDWFEEDPHPHAMLTRPCRIALLKGDKVPDYLNDLNAMHEAENTLSVEQKKWDYQQALHDVVTCGMEGLTVGDVWYLQIHATAIHRAEAFLRTIGKWRE